MISKWSRNGKDGSLSQKIIDKVKPEAPIKNKIDEAQKKLQFQIIKLDEIHEKLKRKHDFVFEKIVDAQRSNNQT